MKRSFLFLFCLPTFTSASQLQMHNAEARVLINGNVLLVHPIAQNVLDVELRPGGNAGASTEMLDPNAKLAVYKATASNDSDGARFHTGAMDILVTPTGEITIGDPNGKLLLRQTAVTATSVSFERTSNENVYGIRAYDLPREQKDKTIKILDGLFRNKGGIVAAGRQGDSGAPLAYTTSFGILIDSNGGRFDVDSNHLAFRNGSNSSLHYFVIVGRPKDVMNRVADLTGHPPMSP